MKNQSAVGDASEHLSAPHPALGGLRLHPHGPRRLRGGEAPDLGKLGLLGSRHIAHRQSPGRAGGLPRLRPICPAGRPTQLPVILARSGVNKADHAPR
jgi:hypothetical protein